MNPPALQVQESLECLSNVPLSLVDEYSTSMRTTRVEHGSQLRLISTEVLQKLLNVTVLSFLKRTSGCFWVCIQRFRKSACQLSATE